MLKKEKNSKIERLGGYKIRGTTIEKSDLGNE
jgi:hypothetical protein